MRVLIDTNILIYREDIKATPEKVSSLLKILQENGYQILVHPASVEDLNKDKDCDRRKIVLSKLEAYPRLTDPPVPDQEYYDRLGNPRLTPNTTIDLQLLYAIYSNAAHVFITEDREIHKFAGRLGIDNRVFTIDRALASFGDQAIKMPEHFRIKLEQMYNIDYKDPFFDSLREDYGGQAFNDWFVARSQEGRQCWVHMINGKLKAILILKDETEIIPLLNAKPLEKKRRLKLATLKVDCRWYRIGELLIKQAIKYCVQNKIDEAYLTHFVKENDDLVKLISNFGFEQVGEKDFKNKNGESEKIFLKKLRPDVDSTSLDPGEILRKFFPSFVDSSRVNKFIVPIRPEYHNRLFQDYIARQHTLTDYTSDIPQGNTIRKAYISNTPSKKMKEGDVLLFYRSEDLKSITSIGTIEKIHYDLPDPDVIWSTLDYNRSVYTYDEVKAFKMPATVIVFRHHFNLETPITLRALIKDGILSAAPMSINILSKEQYDYIKRNGGIDGRFTFD